jgi:hypothetical protein
MEMKVPIGVGVELMVSGVGVGDFSGPDFGGRITRGVGVGPSSGVLIIWATSSSETPVGTDVEFEGIGVVAVSAGVGESKTVGAAIEVHSGGRTF